MKRVLFLASRFPYPAKAGREKTLLQYLSFLKDKAEIYFYFFEKVQPPERLIQEFKDRYKLKQVYFLRLPTLGVALLNVLKYCFIFHKKSIQESIFYSKKIQNFLIKEVVSKNIDIVFVDMIRTAQFFEKFNFKGITKIFDMDDMISRRYEYLVNHSDINILGSFNKNLPKFVSVFIEKYIRKNISKFESKLVENREILLIEKYDKTILVSPQEVELLKKRTGKHNIYYVYPAVEKKELKLDGEKLSPSISFMGLLNFPPNEKALLIFIDKIFPVIIRKYPSIKFFIIGANPTKKLERLASFYNSNIILTGYVNNFAEYILKTDVFIAPIYFGTGIKIKILDAMGLGMPVITTPLGVEGLKVKHLENIVIASDKKEFLSFIDRLLSDPKLRESIGKKAYQYVNTFHNYEEIKEQFLKILNIN